MSTKKMLVLLGVLLISAVLFTACAGSEGAQGRAGPAGPEGPAGPAGPAGESASMGDLTCTECHNDTALITGKKAAWETSVHATGAGLAYAGERGGCAGCHAGSTFSAMIAAGKNFSQVEEDYATLGAAGATHQDCRTCHQIHTTYTGADWALETDAPVTTVTSGATFDGGAGNLCANCHQARRYLAGFAAKDEAGNVIPDKYAANVRFNTHYSVQVDVLMGTIDFAFVEGKPGAHYSMVEDTCVACHMGEGNDHGFTPQLATCQGCHADAEDFNVNGYLTEFEEEYKALEDALKAKGIIDEEGATVTKNADGSPVILDADVAQALFFYTTVHEDGSEGIHNPNYFKALVKAALAALGE